MDSRKDGEELAALLIEGSDEGFLKLVEAFQDRLLNFFYRLTWDRHISEDLTQEVFYRIYRSMGRTFTVTLTATDKMIEQELNGTRSARSGDGRRTGRVFLWVDGPRWFHVEGLEVQAAVDPSWEEAMVAPLVDEELRKILN